jgi:hypothetical protein
VFVYFLACAALAALPRQSYWVDLVGSKSPASVGNGCPDEGVRRKRAAEGGSQRNR